jgi:hypothetical protein
MPDPIWLDTNVLADIANGDTALEAELIALRRAGHQLLIAPAARNELLYGNPLTMDRLKPIAAQQPSPASRAQIELLMKRLDVTVDTAGANVPRSERIASAMQEHIKPKLDDPKLNPDRTPKLTKAQAEEKLVQVVEYDTRGNVVSRKPKLESHPSLDSTSESDRLVLSQIKAGAQARGVKNPRMFTAETGQKGMVGQAKVYGITPMQRAPAKPGPPPPVAPEPPPAPPAAPAKVTPERGGTPKPSATSEPVAAEPVGSGALFRTRITAGVRIAAGTIVLAAIQLLGTWLKSRLDGMHIKYEIERMEPAIHNEIAKRAEEVAHVQVNGDKAYANVTISVLRIFGGGISLGLPQVSFAELAITSREVNVVGGTPPPPMNWTGPWLQRTEHTYSFEVKVFSDAELEDLGKLVEQYLALSDKLRRNAGSVELKQQRDVVRNIITERFGPKVWALQLEAAELPR